MVAWGILGQPLSLESRRPPQPSGGDAAASNVIEARLWEDPLEVLKRAKDAAPVASKGVPRGADDEVSKREKPGAISFEAPLSHTDFLRLLESGAATRKQAKQLVASVRSSKDLKLPENFERTTRKILKQWQDKAPQEEGAHPPSAGKLAEVLRPVIRDIVELHLIVLLPDGTGAEDGEARIRSRQAVTQALLEAQYAPAQQEKMIVDDVSVPGKIPGKLRVPVDEFQVRRVVDRLNGERFREGDIERYFDLIRVYYVSEWAQKHHFTPNSPQLPKGGYPSEESLRKVLFAHLAEINKRYGEQVIKIIGPTNSQSVVALFTTPSSPNDAPAKVAQISFLCPNVTVDGDIFTMQIEPYARKNGFMINSTKKPDANRRRMENFLEGNATLTGATSGPAFPGVGEAVFERMTLSDSDTCRALVSELERHGVDFSNPRQVLVLVSENDTLYGQAFPISFRKAVKEKYNGNDPGADPLRFENISYLRGIDGSSQRSPDEIRQSGMKSSPPPPGGSAPMPGGSLWRPLGDHQYDRLAAVVRQVRQIDEEYARREPLASLRGRTGVVAVGVVGSDVFDKLVVLQALREAVPCAVFFTTDLDSQFLTRENFAFTQGLLVASPFGLRLHPHFHRITPPFRDSSQTAIFYSALKALDYPNAVRRSQLAAGERDIPKTPPATDELTSQANLYQISAQGEVLLRTGREAWSVNAEVFQSPHKWPFLIWGGAGAILLFGLAFWVPPRADLSGSGRFGMTDWLSASGLIVCLVVTGWNCWSASDFRQMEMFAGVLGFLLAGMVVAGFLETAEFSPPSGVRGLLFGLGFFYLVLIAFLAGSLPGEEPWGWFNGASAWPGELLLYLGVVFGIHYLVRGCREMNIVGMRLESLLQAVAAPACRFGLPGSCDFLRELSRRRFCCEQGGYRWGRMGFLLASTLLVSCLMILVGIGFGLPALPVRGAMSRTMDLGISSAVLVVYFGLIVFACYYAWRCLRDLIEPMLKFAPAAAGASSPRVDGNNWLGLLRCVEYYTDRVGRLSLYPCLMLFLLLVSRNQAIDRWNFPLFMVVASGASLFALLGLHFLLHRRAGSLRRRILHGMEVDVYGQMNEDSPLRKIIAEVQGLNQGAFGRPLTNPVFQAVLYPLGGTGVISLVEQLRTLG